MYERLLRERMHICLLVIAPSSVPFSSSARLLLLLLLLHSDLPWQSLTLNVTWN